MTKTPRRKPNARARLACAAKLALCLLPAAHAAEVSEWKNRQPLLVEQAGVIKLALPPATLDLARPGLEDVRLLDPSGREISFLIERPVPDAPPATRPPKSFRATLADSSTQLTIETGTDAALAAIALATPAVGFIKAARVEISADGETWETLSPGTPVFRQFGAEQLQLTLEGRRASRVRITVDDTRSPPIPFTGASVRLTPTTPPSITTPLEIRVLRREEFAGKSVLTLDLGAANVPLAAVEFATAEPLFARNLTLAIRELRDDIAAERTLAAGSIYRVALESLPPGERLEVPVEFTAPSRELLVHIANGDSPPLAIDHVRARQRPRWLVFRATEPGTFTVLTGNPRAPAPRYDLATLAVALKATPPSALTLGPAEPNPTYRRPEALADTPLLGTAIDVTPWAFRKAIHVTAPGVQELELDLEVLAHAQPSLADLRLVREGSQLPYLVERPALSRSTFLTLATANDPKRPRLSRWEIKLPNAGLPLSRLTLNSPTALFRRDLRLFEIVPGESGAPTERTLSHVDWARTPGNTSPLTVDFFSAPATARLMLETDNGDNPPLALTSASATYPVARLLFKIEPGPLALYYGNKEAAAPSYDLALVAAQILTAEKSVATMSKEEAARSEGWAKKILADAKGGALFWGVLALVVVVLLVVVAKLLPKPI